MMGTLTPAHQHIHLSVADETGKVMGGHLLDNTIADTTAELIIHHYPNLSFLGSTIAQLATVSW